LDGYGEQSNAVLRPAMPTITSAAPATFDQPLR
jgi:hypothetical protein